MLDVVSLTRYYLGHLGDFALFNLHAYKSMLFRLPRLTDLLDQMDAVGSQSLGILMFTGLFIGLAITLILQSELEAFGTKVYVGRMLAVASVRELSPVFTALMLSGRVGARIAAELGSMRVSEQIDSIESMGQDPMRKLVTPRILGLFIMAPALTVIVSLITIIGGFVIASVEPRVFWFQVRKAFTADNFVVGLTKPFIFSMIITSFACYLGLTVRGGVRAVGQATARAVVYSSVIIFLADYLISVFFLMAFGI